MHRYNTIGQERAWAPQLFDSSSSGWTSSGTGLPRVWSGTTPGERWWEPYPYCWYINPDSWELAWYKSSWSIVRVWLAVLSAISRRASIPSVTIDYALPTKNTSTSNEPTTQKMFEPQKSVSVKRQTSPSMDQKTSSSMSLENSRQTGYMTSPQGWHREGGMLGRRDSFPISEMPPGPGALHLAAKQVYTWAWLRVLVSTRIN